MKQQQKKWEELTFKNHFIFEQVMQQEALYRHLLQCSLKMPIPDLAFPPQEEKTIKARWQAKGIRLDMFAMDSRGNAYDIELQNKRLKPYKLGLRTRYSQSTTDQHMLDAGHNYPQLRRFICIFICTFDPFRLHLRRYETYTGIRHTKKLRLPDRVKKIFFNIHGTIGDETPDMLALMDYMATGRVQGSFVTAIDAEVQRIKANHEQKERYMSLALDYLDDMQESYAEGKDDGKDEERTNIAQRLLRLGLSLEQIVFSTGLSMEEVRELQQQGAS